jgi:hypothetical protein
MCLIKGEAQCAWRQDSDHLILGCSLVSWCRTKMNPSHLCLGSILLQQSPECSSKDIRTEALFGCMCIYFNLHVLKWNGIEFNLIPLQSTSTHVDWDEFIRIQTRPEMVVNSWSNCQCGPGTSGRRGEHVCPQRIAPFRNWRLIYSFFISPWEESNMNSMDVGENCSRLS